MATGLLANGVCFDASAQAIDAYFSSIPVSVFPDPLNAQVHQVVKYELINGVWMRSVYGSAPWGDTLWASTVAVPPVFPPCDSPSDMFQTGLVVGSAMVGTLMLAWGFNMMRKALL